MLKVFSQTFSLLLLIFLWFPDVFGQPELPTDLKKPKRYENKKLGAEKSAEKKFKGPRKFIQNTVTHYNWYFNANNKLNEILERAKLAHREDYSELLPFYNYTLERTSSDRTELDSVIYKSNTGILSHDLRNAWIDNLYMLIGKAYYFRNDLDSAYLTFQYINYAFSPKEKDGYDIPIGSNASEGSSAMSVSTKEKSSIVRKAISTPPSRNESFIWQIKTYIASEKMPEAASLIQTLKNDPLFPERLKNDLNEVQALWFYQQKMYDSAAIYLENSLPNAADRQETSRWEYLIAQLYELAKKPEAAQKFFEKARKRTLDPVMEVYSILNAIRQNSTDSISIKKNIELLKKMGRKDRYSKYRDIVYYTAAQIELERKNIPGAKAMLLKSAAASTESLNPAQRTKSFLLLGDLSYEEKNYPDAKRFYDSLNNNDPGVEDAAAFDKMKDVLHQIVTQMEIISRQDSLQRLAAMPEPERQALLKKMVRQLRKKQGLKEEIEQQPGNAAVGMNADRKPAPELFDNNAKGDWYFHNAALKSKGFTSFRQTWGTRPNVDNWRRVSELVPTGSGPRDPRQFQSVDDIPDTSTLETGTLSYESLLRNIPLSPQKLEVSQDSIENAMVDLGIAYIDKIEDYDVAIDTLEQFLGRYGYSERRPEGLYYLYYAYRKTGDEARATHTKTELDTKYAGTNFHKIVHNAVTGEGDKDKAAVTREYENIYNKFIEGDFQQAIADKKIADSLHGSGFWSPQLLYIESVYYVHSRNDEEAKKVLQRIIELYPDKPIAEKSKTMLDVLERRREIEDYLTKLEITRVEDTVVIANAPREPGKRIGTPMIQDSTTIQPIKPRNIDTLNIQKGVVSAPGQPNRSDSVKAPVPTSYSFNVEAPHAVIIFLNKVDPVYVNESRNAFNRYNKEKYYNRTIEINNQPLNDTIKMVVMTGFENAAVAFEYMQKTELVASTQIVPWLPSGKYFFRIISHDNLEVLRNKQDMEEYRRFHERYQK